MPARLVVPIPPGVSFRDAACAPVAFGTVQHMLFDNAKLEPGETILVQAGGSGIGTTAIKMAKAIGCTVITTVGDDEKAAKAKALGADHVINYRTDRFEGVVRKLTGKKGVDVAFEHVGPDTFNGSLLCLKRGGRLVTCGSTSGQSITINLFQLYLQQYRIFGSFGCFDAQYPRKPCQDGVGASSGDRYRSAARRVRARACAARKPAGVRQDHRHVLMPGDPAAQERCSTRLSARSPSVCSTASSTPIAGARPISPARSCAGSARCFRSTASVAKSSAPPFRKNPPMRSKKFSPACGTISAASRSSSLISTNSASKVSASRLPMSSPTRRESQARYDWIMKSGKAAIGFAAHLANWELPGIGAKLIGVKSAVLYRRPNIGAVSDAIVKPERAADGRTHPTGLDAPVRLARLLESGVHVGMLADQHYSKGVEVIFFGRRCLANPLIAMLARQTELPIYGMRVVRKADGNSFWGEISAPVEPVRDADGRIEVKGTMQAVTSVIEGWIRQFPEQWLWLHRRWR